MQQVNIKANAKINLTLSVGQVISNGMHPIQSKMTRIALADELEVTRIDNHALSRYAILWHEDAPKVTEIDWPITNDLAVRAHQALEQVVGYALPIQMKLEKRIPVGGGLGGGSADAAAMLQATITLFDLDINPQEIAIKLGSDVPFFLQPSAGIVSGTGEVVEPFEMEQLPIVLVIPEYSCPTSEVFNAFDKLNCSSVDSFTNDLLAPACIVEERLKEDMDQIKTLVNTDIHLSGSGSTMFIICDNTESANQKAKEIESHTQHVALATRTC
jgi:4-diphosphocytidyl-2-C-methyl-D-erythritol kinase